MLLACYLTKYTKRVSVTEPEESDVPDKLQRDGIGGQASFHVAAVDNKPLSLSALIYKSFKKN